MMNPAPGQPMSPLGPHHRAKPHILVAVEETSLAQALNRYLSRRFEVRVEYQRSEALNWVRDEKPDILISNYGTGGLTLFMEARRLHPDGAQIMLGGGADLDGLLSQAHQARIDFFIPLPLHPVALLQAVEKLWKESLIQSELDLMRRQNKRMKVELEKLEKALAKKVESHTQRMEEANQTLLSSIGQMTEENRSLRELNEMLNELATRDPLTGLFNRRAFHTRLNEEWHRSQRQNYPLSVIMLDIDHFKLINDSKGHECGDKVLRKLGELMNDEKRAQDVVCRYGGEEFVIILPDTRMDAALGVAESLREKVGHHYFSCNRSPLKVRISLGVSGVEESGAANMDELVNLADQALYRAKAGGRDRSEVYLKTAPPNGNGKV